MVRLICQLQEGGLRHANLEQLYQAVLRLDVGGRPRRSKVRRKPLRSRALLSLSVEELTTDYLSGIAPYTLAIKYGIDRETVAKRLRDAGILTSSNLGRASKA
jgi:hypothetical protein